MSEWGLSYLKAAKDARVLDIGCGGGANIERLLAENGFEAVGVNIHKKGWLCIAAGI